MKLLALPFTIGTGLIAGQVAKRVFDLLWRLIDDQEAPEPEHREVSLPKLLLALAIEGAIYRVVRGFVDRGGRHGVLALTGSWPGDERPDKV